MFRRKGLLTLFAFAMSPLWAQVDSSGAPPAGEGAAIWTLGHSSGNDNTGEDDPMVTPAPLNGEGYSMAFSSETPRTNFLRGGLNISTAYDDNVVPSSGRAVSDVAYSIWPSLALEQSRSRLRWNLSYSPGYTFHQKLDTINGLDHSLALGLEYRLSPHVTMKVSNSFQKTRDLLNFREQSAETPTTGGLNEPNDSIVPPGTIRINNFSNAEISYQFGPNAMVGATGTLYGLWYPDRSQIPGLHDSIGQSATGFYAHRLSGKHYIGATYGFQRLLSLSQSETRTQSTLLFYTLYLPPNWALSVFIGPEHSDSHFESLISRSRWTPAAGGTLSWQGEHASFGSSFEHRISDGGGLAGAVLSNRADVSARWQMAGALTAGLGAGYSTNSVLDSQEPSGVKGHSWSTTASFQHPLGERLALQMGYTHLHQSYGSIAAIAQAPERNYVWMSIAYEFLRPLGR